MSQYWTAVFQHFIRFPFSLFLSDWIGDTGRFRLFSLYFILDSSLCNSSVNGSYAGSNFIFPVEVFKNKIIFSICILAMRFTLILREIFPQKFESSERMRRGVCLPVSDDVSGLLFCFRLDMTWILDLPRESPFLQP